MSQYVLSVRFCILTHQAGFDEQYTLFDLILNQRQFLKLYLMPSISITMRSIVSLWRFVDEAVRYWIQHIIGNRMLCQGLADQ